MREVVIASAVRTPIGSFQGCYKDVPAAELGKVAIVEALNRAGLKPVQVDEVILGCVLQAGLYQGVARQAAVAAGIPVEKPAMTINMICGSGLRSVELAAQAVKTGDAVACVEDYPVMGYGISQGNGLKMVGDMVQGSSYGFAVLKGNNPELIEMFDAGLANLKANGKYQEILDTYISRG